MTFRRVEDKRKTPRCPSEALNSCTYSKQDAFCVTLKGFGLEHILFSRFVRMIDVNFICPACYLDIPQSVNPDCSISIIHGGRLGKAFIMFSDTVNILWIFASVERVNEISPAAGGKGTSGPLSAHVTFQQKQFILNYETVELKGWTEHDFRNTHSMEQRTLLLNLLIYFFV